MRLAKNKRKEKRNTKRRKSRAKGEKEKLFVSPLLRGCWALLPPLHAPRAGFLNFVTFKFKHSHLLRSRPVPYLCLLPMPILSLLLVVVFLLLSLRRVLASRVPSFLDYIPPLSPEFIGTPFARLGDDRPSFYRDDMPARVRLDVNFR